MARRGHAWPWGIRVDYGLGTVVRSRVPGARLCWPKITQLAIPIFFIQNSERWWNFSDTHSWNQLLLEIWFVLHSSTLRTAHFKRKVVLQAFKTGMVYVSGNVIWQKNHPATQPKSIRPNSGLWLNWFTCSIHPADYDLQWRTCCLDISAAICGDYLPTLRYSKKVIAKVTQ